MYELIDWTAWDDAGLPPSRRFARDTSEGRRFDWPNILLSMAFSLLVVEPVAYLVGGALDRAAHEATPTELVAEQADLSGGKPFPKLLYVAPGWPPLQVVPSEATDREQTQPLGYLLVVGGEYSLCKDGLLVEEPKCLYDLGLTRRSDEAQGPFVLRWCPSCGAYVLYLADACPFCSGQL
ncbi:MAG: hypothetical protein FJX74_09225 [Armatimonadetes bacterium]|nr:hypothetical protein [Armatimonadota bacterium]